MGHATGQRTNRFQFLLLAELQQVGDALLFPVFALRDIPHIDQGAIRIMILERCSRHFDRQFRAVQSQIDLFHRRHGLVFFKQDLVAFFHCFLEGGMEPGHHRLTGQLAG